MLNHIYTSVKNANLVNSGNTQYIPSQPSPLVKENFLGEFRTELDKKKVLANLGIATELSLEWANIKGDVASNPALLKEFEDRTTYVSAIDGMQKTLIDGISYLETVVGGEQEGEEEQNERLTDLELIADDLVVDLEELKDYLETTIEVDIDTLEEKLTTITDKVDNITSLIQVSTKEGNALSLITEGDTPGLYVPDLSETLNTAVDNVEILQSEVTNIKDSLDTFVTKEALGGDDFDFVDQGDFDTFVKSTSTTLSNIQGELANTVKTGEDGHVNTLYVKEIRKNGEDSDIKIYNSFDVDSNIPLDIRLVKNTVEDLYQIPAKTCYPGMGVIVSSTSSLYILRDPEPGVSINQDYVSNPASWRCPEDLVTVALTSTEYETLKKDGGIDERVFYYVYEDEIVRNKEPKRDEFDSDEAFDAAWQEWVDSLKTLSQEYMSASWGVTIEEKLSEKASTQSLNVLAKEIENIKGSDGTSLGSLHTMIQEVQTSTNKVTETVTSILEETDGTESGRLVDVEKKVTQVTSDLNNYVKLDQLEELSGGFNFATPGDLSEAIEEVEESIKESVATEELLLNDTKVTTKDGTLLVGNSPIAKASDIPSIQIMSQQEYNDIPNKDEDVYYYTFDGDEIYVTKSELTSKVSQLESQIQALLVRISALESTSTPNEPTE